MSQAKRWLKERLPSAPARLLDAMVEALPADDPPIPDALAHAAITLYASVLAGSGGREDALPLLAADALFTHAFEAQAEADPTGIASFAELWGPRGVLADLMP